MTTTDDTKAQDHLLRAIEYLDGKGIEAGVFGGTSRGKSKPKKRGAGGRFVKSGVRGKGTPIALYGFIQHEGTRDGKIKPRRWLSGAVDANQSTWDLLFENGMDQVLSGSQTMNGLLTTIAQTAIIGGIQRMITTLHVIDSGDLRRAIRAKIVGKGAME